MKLNQRFLIRTESNSYYIVEEYLLGGILNKQKRYLLLNKDSKHCGVIYLKDPRSYSSIMDIANVGVKNSYAFDKIINKEQFLGKQLFFSFMAFPENSNNLILVSPNTGRTSVIMEVLEIKMNN